MPAVLPVIAPPPVIRTTATSEQIMAANFASENLSWNSTDISIHFLG